MREITQEQVRHFFLYDEGVLFWRNPPREHLEKKEKIAGGMSPKGYHKIQILGHKHPRSRLVFLYHHGRFPNPVCDHINRNRADDHIENLREVSLLQNALNNGKACATKRRNGKFQARIGHRHIGMFNTRKEAKDAVKFEKTNRFGV